MSQQQTQVKYFGTHRNHIYPTKNFNLTLSSFRHVILHIPLVMEWKIHVTKKHMIALIAGSNQGTNMAVKLKKFSEFSFSILINHRLQRCSFLKSNILLTRK